MAKLRIVNDDVYLDIEQHEQLDRPLVVGGQGRNLDDLNPKTIQPPPNPILVAAWAVVIGAVIGASVVALILSHRN